MTTARGSNTDDLFTALAHPTRRQILRELIADGGELSPRELAARLTQPLTRLSYHVRTLAQCGALELVRTKQIRGSTQHFYRPVVDAPWAKLALAEGDAPSGGRAT